MSTILTSTISSSLSISSLFHNSSRAYRSIIFALTAFMFSYAVSVTASIFSHASTTPSSLYEYPLIRIKSNSLYIACKARSRYSGDQDITICIYWYSRSTASFAYPLAYEISCRNSLYRGSSAIFALSSSHFLSSVYDSYTDSVNS